MTKQRRWGILIGTLLFALLSVICLWLGGPAIEKDLAQKTRANLAEVGLGELDVDFDGRDATISGAIPAAAAGALVSDRAALVNYIDNEAGVRTVNVDGVSNAAIAPAPTAVPTPAPTATAVPAPTAVPATAVPPTAVPAAIPTGTIDTEAVVEGSGIVLNGEVLTEGHRTTLVDAAVAEYGVDNVTDNLTVSGLDAEIAGADGRVAALAGLIPVMNNNLLNGRASLAAEDLNLTGLASSAEAKAAVDAARGATGMGGSSQITVDAVTVVNNLDLSGVQFESGTAVLTAESTAILDDAAAQLLEFEDVNLEVAGHTDAQGSAESNQTLSQERAETVQQYLVAAGVSEFRLTATGYGESQPIDTNDSDEGRQANRRVELVVQEG